MVTKICASKKKVILVLVLAVIRSSSLYVYAYFKEDQMGENYPIFDFLISDFPNCLIFGGPPRRRGGLIGGLRTRRRGSRHRPRAPDSEARLGP